MAPHQLSLGGKGACFRFGSCSRITGSRTAGLPNRVRWCCKATKTPGSPPSLPVVDQLNAEEKEKWAESLDIVKSLGFEDEKAESLLSRGFGWGSQVYWQGSKTNEVPDAQLIKERLAYLDTVGIKGEDVTTVVSKFPEVLGCDIEERLKPNMEFLEKNYFLKGPVRTKVILRKPKVIGNVIDCEGDCQGECSRCWAQF